MGADADIVIFDPEKKHTITAATHHMNVDYNVYEGMEVTGWPVRVLSRGRTLVDNGEWKGEAGYGEFIPRSTGGAVL